MSDPKIQQFSSEADKIIQHLHSEFARLQTGRASAALLEGAKVEAYGAIQPLKSVAGIMVQDARSMIVQPWDRSILANVEKALVNLDLGCQPVNDGVVLRINLPPMTEERREQMKKLVGKLAEEARIAVRQQRQDLHADIRNNEQDEDRMYTLLEELDKAVKSANEKIEEAMRKKEDEMMKV